MKNEIVQLQKVMEERNIDFYLVPMTDYNQSEFIGDYFKSIEFLTGFTGSAGFLLVSRNEAFLWTDGRYFIQGENQLKGSGIVLMKDGEEGVPSLYDYLIDVVEDYQTIGFDGKVMNFRTVHYISNCLEEKKVSFNFENVDLVDLIWKNRPKLEGKDIYYYHIDYSGMPYYWKVSNVRKEMRRVGIDCYISANLEEVAWLLNLRGNDIAYTPVFYSYIILLKDKVKLFVLEKQVEKVKSLVEELGYKDVSVFEYSHIYEHVKSIPTNRLVAMDLDQSSADLVCSLQDLRQLVVDTSYIKYMKAEKNQVELDMAKVVHQRDGVALAKFLYWVEKEGRFLGFSEYEISQKLHDFRKEQKGFVTESFETICGYNERGAIIHYAPSKRDSQVIGESGYLLVDSGGQYFGGTTDVTRTIVLGQPSQEFREAYTAVLKGHIALGSAVFNNKTTGKKLDSLCRSPLQSYGYDFNHGSGHGVGSFLCVHEGPYSIGRRATEALPPNIIISNEPGYYKEGAFGIRIENLIFTKKRKDDLVEMENLTLCGYDKNAIDFSMLTEDEIDYIKNYHKLVEEKICPLLDEKVASWYRDFLKINF